MRGLANLLAASLGAWLFCDQASHANVLAVPDLQLRADRISIVSVVSTSPHGIAAVPNDPMFVQQWALENTGQTGGTSGSDIDAVRAWDVETGVPSVVVAILGTGIDFNHPDLATRRWTNPGEIAGNGIDDDQNGFIDDVHGWDFVNNDADPADDNSHGTFLAGTAAAAGNDGFGIAGVAWDVRLLAVKSLDASGSGTMFHAIQAVNYATHIGATVILASWGGGPFSQALYDAIAAAESAGIPFVAVAGASHVNIDLNPVYPASYAIPNVIAVTATDANDALASFSNWGPNTVDLGAPGVGIRTTTLGGGHVTVSGSSLAAAYVAGALAVLASHFPGLQGTAAVEHLVSHVDVVPALVDRVQSDGRLNVYLPLVETPTDVSLGVEPPGRGLRAWWIPGQDGSRIGFALPQPGGVRLEIFDVRGRRLWKEDLGAYAAGLHAWHWDGLLARGGSAASGVYFVRLHSGASTTARIILGSK